MRIFIITLDEPFFLPDFFEKIIAERLSDVIGIAITPPFPRKLWIKHILKEFQLHGFFDFLVYLYNYSIAKFCDFIGLYYKNKNCFSIVKLAKSYNIQVYKIGDPNDPSFLKFSIICSYFFCFCAHGTDRDGCLLNHLSNPPSI